MFTTKKSVSCKIFQLTARIYSNKHTRGTIPNFVRVCKCQGFRHCLCPWPWYLHVLRYIKIVLATFTHVRYINIQLSHSIGFQSRLMSVGYLNITAINIKLRNFILFLNKKMLFKFGIHCTIKNNHDL